MVKVWFPPELTVTLPEGEMEPLLLADAVMMYEVMTNVTLIEWFEVTLLKVYEEMGPWDTPSTFTSATL
jgi:hypothetical protein